MTDARQQQLADDVAAALHRALCSSCYPAARTGFLFASADADKAFDALLPLLDQVAADGAAEALESAADELHVQRFNADQDPGERWPVGCDQKPDLFYAGITTARGHLRARAAELRAPARTDEEN